MYSSQQSLIQSWNQACAISDTLICAISGQHGYLKQTHVGKPRNVILIWELMSTPNVVLSLPNPYGPDSPLVLLPFGAHVAQQELAESYVKKECAHFTSVTFHTWVYSWFFLVLNTRIKTLVIKTNHFKVHIVQHSENWPLFSHRCQGKNV